MRRCRVTDIGVALSFNVYPDLPRREFVRVVIFKHKQAAREYHRVQHKATGSPLFGAALGCFHAWDVVNFGGKRSRSARSRRGRLKPIVGELHLLKTALTMRVISHECTHAGLAYVRRRRMDLNDNPPRRHQPKRMDIYGPEETLCYAVGDMAAQIVSVADRKGWL